ncbi:MAG TPA: c-type cytochrome [Myxococcota bacterium]|nr:c-type cytochrome [Myxococcota bacterium]
MKMSGAMAIALAIGALGFAAQVGGQEKETTVADVGRGVFEQYCASCHGVDGKGGGEFAKYLKTPPPDLTLIAKRRGGNFPETELAGWIDGRDPFPGHGTREMPIWGQRFDSVVPGTTAKQASIRHEVILLVAYLRSIQQK